MSTSSLPASSKFRAPAAPVIVKPPILASDILREEVAPREPARRAIQVALLAFAATFGLAALAATGALGPVRLDAPLALEGSEATAVVATLAALAPWSYAARATLAAVAGLAPLALAAARLGPLAPLGDDGLVAACAFAAMATLLPAALVFRARYRAFRGARAILGVALLLSLPAALLLGKVALDGGADTGARIVGAVGVAACAASTLGFMGPETSAGCTQWAALVLGVMAARPAGRAVAAAWSGRDREMVAAMAAGLGELIASTLVTFALFQLFAAVFRSQARLVNVRKAVGAGASEAPPARDEDDTDGDENL
jgi:hypothetical protein